GGSAARGGKPGRPSEGLWLVILCAAGALTGRAAFCDHGARRPAGRPRDPRRTPPGVHPPPLPGGGAGAPQPAPRSALRGRALAPAAVCPDLDCARDEALRRPGDAHLFIVQLGPADDPAWLSALTGSLPGQPVLALLPPGADLAKLLAAQRARAAQVVLLPWQADDFLRALDGLAFQFAPPAPHAPP